MGMALIISHSPYKRAPQQWRKMGTPITWNPAVITGPSAPAPMPCMTRSRTVVFDGTLLPRSRGHHDDGLHQDGEVQPQAPPFHVLGIEIDVAIERGVLAGFHLPQSR